jgi:hypothetical protein
LIPTIASRLNLSSNTIGIASNPTSATSIVEGISIFLSLFDDNPRVKRLFCPPAELYEPGASPIKGKQALPPLGNLLEQGKIIASDRTFLSE